MKSECPVGIVARHTRRSVEDSLEDTEAVIVGDEVVVEVIGVHEEDCSRIVGIEVVEIRDAVEVDEHANAEEEPAGIAMVFKATGAIVIVDAAGDAEMETVGAVVGDGVVDEVGRE